MQSVLGPSEAIRAVQLAEVRCQVTMNQSNWNGIGAGEPVRPT